MKDGTFPTISVVTPTLNAGKVLETELESIRNQDYPQEKIEIIIADGGSTDNTLEIARKFDCVTVENKLKTGEAGKAVGVKHAKGDLIALIDSDNILPDRSWLQSMVKPLVDNVDVIASEPWKYTYRPEGGFIERYCALLGMNDPIVLFYGNYDRFSTLTGKWTGIDLETKDHGDWLEVQLSKEKPVPTIGANGTIFRKDFLTQSGIGDYLFDIDILQAEVKNRGELKVAKVKVGIIHSFCENSVRKFARKQRRRVLDYLFHKKQKDREAEWSGDAKQLITILKFSLYSLSVVLPLWDSYKGYRKIKDWAWFFHPLACLITWWEYSYGHIKGLFKSEESSRDKYCQ